MAVLDALEPKPVFKFFEDISAVPRGSGNVKGISDFLVKFAKDRNLEVVQDELLNVIIKAPATAGYEDHERVILQGHMDMVAVCEEGSGIDMTTTPIKLLTDGEWITADKTTLGADDGIAVAMCMAILDSKDIPHPPLTVLITTDEETGMFGAVGLDPKYIDAKKLINIDSEDEGVILSGCAGGGRFNARLSYKKTKVTGTRCRLSINGLSGGHSGALIHLERGNANCLIGRILYQLTAGEGFDFSLISLKGGEADNAIAAVSEAYIVLPEGIDFEAFTSAAAKIESEIKSELEGKDEGFKLSVSAMEKGSFDCFEAESARKALGLLCSMPNGVQAMSATMKGLVETSLNLGILRTDEENGTITLSYAVRSSVESSKLFLIDKLKLIAEAFGAAANTSGLYPGWKYSTVSPLRDTLSLVYENMYGKKPVVEAIHAGVECGFFIEKSEGLDCVSIGPDMEAIHSPAERLSVASTKNVYEYLCEVLKAL